MSPRRSLAAALAVLAAAALAAPVSANATAHLRLAARAAIVIEPQTGDVVYARNPEAELPIASTTKLMTALVAVGRLPLTRLVTVAPYHPGPLESLAYLHAGERMSVRDLLRALLLPSANDAAYTLAVRAAGSESRFVALMNARANRMGLRHTHYDNPIGLDQPGGYSSARDLVRVAAAVLANPFLAATVDRPRATLLTGSHVRHLVNRNDLVGRYPWVVGIKTGHTSLAGYVLVGAARRDGVEVISAVLDDPSESSRDADTLTLLRYGLSRFHRVTAVRRGQLLATLPLSWRSGQHVDLVAARTVRAVVPRGTRPRVRLPRLPASVDGPLPAGARLGTATLLVRGRTVGRVALVTDRPVAAAGFATKAGDVLSRPGVAVAIAFALACSLLLGLMRRRAQRRRRTARHRGGAEAA